MQRKQQADARKQSAALERKQQQDAWTVERPEDDALTADDAVVCVADVPDPSLPRIFGRRSFGGFNKGVEVHHADEGPRARSFCLLTM